MLYTTLIYIVARFIPAAFTMGTLYYYTNTVTPSDYGDYANIISTASIVYPIIFAPIWYYILRYRLERGRQVVVEANSISVLIMCLTIPIVIWSHYFTSTSNGYYVSVILMILTFGMFQVGLEQQRSVDAPNRYLILAVARSVLILVVSYLFITYHISLILNPIVDATIISIAVVTLPSLWNSLIGFKISMVWQNLSNVYRYGIFLALGMVVNTALFTADRIIIYYFTDSHIAGLYASPYDLAMKLIYTVIFSLELSMLPTLLKVKHMGEDLSMQFCVNLKTYLFLVTPVLVVLLSFSREITHIYFPEEYRETALSVLPVVMIATYIVGFSHAIFHHAYIISGENRKYFLTIMCILIINCTLNIFSSFYNQPYFASYVALVTFSLYTAITYYYSSSKYHFKLPIAFIIKVFVLCGLALLFKTYLLAATNFYILGVDILLFLFVYVIMAVSINLLDSRIRLRLALNKIGFLN